MIVVTGAAGFIGSHLSKRLNQEGYYPLLLDDFSRGKQKYLDDLKVKAFCHDVDLTDSALVNYWIGQADTVFHIASRIGGNQFLHGSSLNELNALQTNMAIDNNVFRACEKYKVKKVIYTSSVSVYNTDNQANSPNAMFRETDLEKQPLDPEGGYGWAKLMGEKQLQLMSGKYGIARIFKSYGPCDDYSEESGQVVCALMRKAINYPKESYKVWGDGTTTRCLVYIDDLIDALLKIYKYLNKSSTIVNIGGDRPISVKELAETIIKVSSKDIEIEWDKTKPTGVQSRIPILDKAKKELNWKPTTSLKDGLKKTYEWMEQDLKMKEECPRCGKRTIDMSEAEPMCDLCGWAQ